MVLDNINCSEVIHNKLKKCEFCGKELAPIGLDYLYANISPDAIKYERCDCNKAQEYWKRRDEQEYEIQKRKHFRDVINKLYKQNYNERKFQNLNFENFNINSGNEIAVKVANDYTDKCIAKVQTKGLIITGESGLGKTHLTAAIANKLIEKGQIVLIGRLTTLLDKIKETFADNTISENELIELYSNIDMIIIDDLGTERVSKWALEKLYTIIENRNENRLPIIITTRFNKDGLLQRFKEGQDEELADAVINKLYQMCYGVTLINEKRVSKSC